jgi:hypothetical protein
VRRKVAKAISRSRPWPKPSIYRQAKAAWNRVPRPERRSGSAAGVSATVMKGAAMIQGNAVALKGATLAK